MCMHHHHQPTAPHRRSLFLESTREELFTEVESVQRLAAAAGKRGNQLVIVLATSGTPLSPAVASLPPLQPPPYGPKPLPFVGNLLCLISGPYEIPMYNVWHHIFAPAKLARYGDTVRFVVPENPPHAHKEGPGGWDHPLARTETIFTIDPEVVGELLARQDEFQKVGGREGWWAGLVGWVGGLVGWRTGVSLRLPPTLLPHPPLPQPPNRPQQQSWTRKPELSLKEFAGNGIFTSSTYDSDWQTAHGMLPRFYNALKIRTYYPASEPLLVGPSPKQLILRWAFASAGACWGLSECLSTPPPLHPSTDPPSPPST